MHTFQKLLLALALIAGISCNPRNTSIPAYHPDFVHHISAYTSGYVERDAIIKVVLTKPVSPKDQEKVLKNELFRFEPELDKLIADAGRFGGRLSTFCDEFSAVLSRQLDAKAQ